LATDELYFKVSIDDPTDLPQSRVSESILLSINNGAIRFRTLSGREVRSSLREKALILYSVRVYPNALCLDFENGLAPTRLNLESIKPSPNYHLLNYVDGSFDTCILGHSQ
jgi:hypothetical protein